LHNASHKLVNFDKRIKVHSEKMACFKPFRKWTVLSFNIIFLLVGIAVIVMGAVLVSTFNSLKQAIPSSYHQYLAIPVILLILGSLLVLITTFGSFGVFKKNAFLVTTYTIILLVICVVQIIFGIFIFWSVSHQEDLKGSVNETVDAIYTNWSNNTELIDFMQKKLECCGSSGPRNWGSRLASCHEDGDSRKKVYNDDCQTALYNFVLNSERMFGMTVLLLSIIGIIGVVLSLSLANTIRNQNRRRKF
jgi:CD63 antigen